MERRTLRTISPVVTTPVSDDLSIKCRSADRAIQFAVYAFVVKELSISSACCGH
jgi:hypothetical protein